MSERATDIGCATAATTALVTGLTAALAAFAGCTVQDTVAVQSCSSDEPCPPQDPAAFCDGTTSLLLAGAAADEPALCMDALAASLFEHALCVCGELALGPPLTTDSFDSAQGPYVPGGGGIAAAIGINDKLEAIGSLQVGGPLVVAGVEGINANDELHVAGDLASAGRLGSAMASVTVAGDAEIAGSIDLADASVAGVLTVPTEHTIAVAGALTVGENRRAPVGSVSPSVSR